MMLLPMFLIVFLGEKTPMTKLKSRSVKKMLILSSFIFFIAQGMAQELGLQVDKQLMVLFGDTSDTDEPFFSWDGESGSLRFGVSELHSGLRGFASTSWGDASVTPGSFSTAWGTINAAIGRYSTAWGQSNFARSENETVLGYFSTDYTPFPQIPNGKTSLPNPNNRLFVIGNGITDEGAGRIRSNALTMLKNGNTGFGIDPYGKGYKMRILGSRTINLDTSALSIESPADFWYGHDQLLMDGNDIDAAHSTLNINRYSDQDIVLVKGGGTVNIISNEDVETFPNYREGALAIGSLSGNNIAIDGNEIMARNSDVPDTLFMQADGGVMRVGDITASNLNINGTEILAQNGANAADLFVQPIGGDIKLGTALGSNTDVYVSSLAGGGLVDVQADNTGKLIMSSSDLRLKKDLLEIEDALEKVLRLQGKSYHWKDGRSSKRSLGLIAQEVKEVVPEVVTYNGSVYGINYSQLPALLVEAIKEQQEIIEKQQAQIDQLLKMMKQIANGE